MSLLEQQIGSIDYLTLYSQRKQKPSARIFPISISSPTTLFSSFGYLCLRFCMCACFSPWLCNFTFSKSKKDIKVYTVITLASAAVHTQSIPPCPLEVTICNSMDSLSISSCKYKQIEICTYIYISLNFPYVLFYFLLYFT